MACTLEFENGIFEKVWGSFTFELKENKNSKIKYSFTDPIKEKTDFVEKYLRDIVPDENERNMMLHRITRCLVSDGGCVGNDNILILNGDNGSNGKSVFVNFVMSVFGEYSTTTDITTNSNARISFLTECYKVVKDAFRDTNIFFAMHNNYTPDLTQKHIINFPTRFCSNPQEPNERLVDPNISTHLNDCRNEFVHILLNIYPLKNLSKP